MYRDIVEVFSKAQSETLLPDRSIAINVVPDYNVLSGHI